MTAIRSPMTTDQLRSDSTMASQRAAMQFLIDRFRDLPKGRVVYGIKPSNGTDVANDLNFSAGVALSNSGFAIPITATTKRLDATFALGSGAGGLASALTISDTSYHAHALFNPETGLSDIGYDTSATAANLLADAVAINAGLIEYCRVFSIKRISSNLQVFTAPEISGGGLLVQIAPQIDSGLIKDWTGADDAAQTGTSAVVPSGVQMLGRWTFFAVDVSVAAATSLLFTSFDVTDTAPVADATNPFTAFLGDLPIYGGSDANSFAAQVLTRASDGAIRYRGTGTTADHSLGATCHGWIDYRVA